MDIPKYALDILRGLEENGHEAYFAGGCVRDMLSGREPYDWDITTSALPQEIKSCFPRLKAVDTGIKHGTVTIISEGRGVEVTTYRSESGYKDHRRPDSVSFSLSVEKDLERRDFTVNAMAYNPQRGFKDPFGGRNDLEKGILRAVGDPRIRFNEDALRILRGIRFMSLFGYRAENDTFSQMKACSYLLRYVSGERVLSELIKTVMGEHVLLGLMESGGIIASAIPEIAPMVGFDQRNRHHIYDVWEHTVRALAASERQKDVRLALLLHDMGKPASFTQDTSGEGHYYGHAMLSAEMAERVLSRLNCPKALKNEAVWLIRYHDISIPPTRSAAGHMLALFGRERAHRLLEVKIADNSAHSPRYAQRAEDARQLMHMIQDMEKSAPCLDKNGLDIKASQLEKMGYRGNMIAKALDSLLAAVICSACENESEKLTAYLKSYIALDKGAVFSQTL